MAKAVKYLRFAAGALALALWLLPGSLLILLRLRNLAMMVWCRLALFAIGAKLRVSGASPGPGSLVAANHSSYVDIFALGAVCPGAFLGKSEIAGWPLIGALSRLAGVIFVQRGKARSSSRSLSAVRERLEGGERVLLFPEGGIIGESGEVTRFHSMFFDAAAVGANPVVPTAIRYVHPKEPSAWLWRDGETPFGHLVGNLLPADYITIALVFGQPLSHGPETGRKDLADAAQRAVEALWSGAKE